MTDSEIRVAFGKVRLRSTWASLLVMLLVVSAVHAHPGSGIVVDRLGNVYFVDTGAGVWKIDLEGALVRVEGPAYHWMSLDEEDGFAGGSLPASLRGDVSVVGAAPTLIVGGDFPLTMGFDGALYYPQARGDSPLRIVRLAPSGSQTEFATLPDAFEVGPDGGRIPAKWIHGLAAGRDGSLYYTERRAVRRIAPDGSPTLVVGDVDVPDCVLPPALKEHPHVAPDLRGLDVGADGTVYVAATACSALLKITSNGDVSVLLRSSDAWTPTGVAVRGRELYVLEYRYIASQRREDWLPRVRKVTADGRATVAAEVRQR